MPSSRARKASARALHFILSCTSQRCAKYSSTKVTSYPTLAEASLQRFLDVGGFLPSSRRHGGGFLPSSRRHWRFRRVNRRWISRLKTSGWVLACHRMMLRTLAIQCRMDFREGHPPYCFCARYPRSFITFRSARTSSAVAGLNGPRGLPTSNPASPMPARRIGIGLIRPF